jgi:hypothetical protein
MIPVQQIKHMNHQKAFIKRTKKIDINLSKTPMAISWGYMIPQVWSLTWSLLAPPEQQLFLFENNMKKHGTSISYLNNFCSAILNTICQVVYFFLCEWAQRFYLHNGEQRTE